MDNSRYLIKVMVKYPVGKMKKWKIKLV